MRQYYEQSCVYSLPSRRRRRQLVSVLLPASLRRRLGSAGRDLRHPRVQPGAVPASLVHQHLTVRPGRRDRHLQRPHDLPQRGRCRRHARSVGGISRRRLGLLSTRVACCSRIQTISDCIPLPHHSLTCGFNYRWPHPPLHTPLISSSLPAVLHPAGGSWSSSCSPLAWNPANHSLVAACAGYVSAIDYSLCASGATLANINGALTCSSVAPELPSEY